MGHRYHACRQMMNCALARPIRRRHGLSAIVAYFSALSRQLICHGGAFESELSHWSPGHAYKRAIIYQCDAFYAENFISYHNGFQRATYSAPAAYS